MRVFLIAATLALLTVPAAMAEPDPLAGMCDEGDPVGDALRTATGDCGGTVEPWMCLGGSSSSKGIQVGPYTIIVNVCDFGPDPW